MPRVALAPNQDATDRDAASASDDAAGELRANVLPLNAGRFETLTIATTSHPHSVSTVANMKAALTSLLFLLSSGLTTVHAASDKPLKPCTIVSPTTERFFDLNGLRRTLPKEGEKKKDADEGSWHAKGYDYGANFTVNFCGPVVEELDEVQDLDKKLWQNVSAYYEVGSKQYAIG